MSRTAKQWVDSLIQPIFIMLLFVRAELEGDWPLNLLSVDGMMPYFFDSVHYTSARYGILYLRLMQHLHPVLLKRFMAGEHVMHHTERLWNGIWSDLYTDSTYMRNGHDPSLIIGATLSETTLATWALSQTQWDKCRMMSLNWTTTKIMLCCVIWKNSQFKLTTIQVTGRAFAKQLHHALTCLMWVNIKLNDEALLPGQAMALNVAANKEQLIRLLVKHMWKLLLAFD